MKKVSEFFNSPIGRIIIAAIIIIAIICTFLFVPKKKKNNDALDIYDVETSYLEGEHTPNPTIDEPTAIETDSDTEYFINSARGYKFKLPSGFSVYEGNGTLYVRNTETRTQIAIIILTGTYSDGISTYEACMNRIYQLTALLEDKDGIVADRICKNYGTKAKADKQVGSFAVKTEEAEIWWRNTGDLDNIILPSCDYFTTRANGNGMALLGVSQTEETSKVFGYMDQILESFEEIEIEEKPLNTAVYTSDRADRTSFIYPADWTVTKNEDGMVVISAGNSEANPYAGMVIEAFADQGNRYVEDYAQFTTLYEPQFAAPAFTQAVSRSTFEVNPSVDNMDFDKPIGGISECIYMEVNTQIIPKSIATQNSLGVNGSMIHNYRYAYKVGTTDCCINFIVPEGNDAALELMQKIVESITF